MITIMAGERAHVRRCGGRPRKGPRSVRRLRCGIHASYLPRPSYSRGTNFSFFAARRLFPFLICIAPLIRYCLPAKAREFRRHAHISAHSPAPRATSSRAPYTLAPLYSCMRAKNSGSLFCLQHSETSFSVFFFGQSLQRPH